VRLVPTLTVTWVLPGSLRSKARCTTNGETTTYKAINGLANVHAGRNLLGSYSTQDPAQVLGPIILVGDKVCSTKEQEPCLYKARESGCAQKLRAHTLLQQAEAR